MARQDCEILTIDDEWRLVELDVFEVLNVGTDIEALSFADDQARTYPYGLEVWHGTFPLKRFGAKEPKAHSDT